MIIKNIQNYFNIFLDKQVSWLFNRGKPGLFYRLRARKTCVQKN